MLFQQGFFVKLLGGLSFDNFLNLMLISKWAHIFMQLAISVTIFKSEPLSSESCTIGSVGSYTEINKIVYILSTQARVDGLFIFQIRVRLSGTYLPLGCVSSYFDCHNVDASTVFDKTCPILRDDSIQFTFCVAPQSLSDKVHQFFDLGKLFGKMNQHSYNEICQFFASYKQLGYKTPNQE